MATVVPLKSMHTLHMNAQAAICNFYVKCNYMHPGRVHLSMHMNTQSTCWHVLAQLAQHGLRSWWGAPSATRCTVPPPVIYAKKAKIG